MNLDIYSYQLKELDDKINSLHEQMQKLQSKRQTITHQMANQIRTEYPFIYRIEVLVSKTGNLYVTGCFSSKNKVQTMINDYTQNHNNASYKIKIEESSELFDSDILSLDTRPKYFPYSDD